MPGTRSLAGERMLSGFRRSWAAPATLPLYSRTHESMSSAGIGPDDQILNSRLVERGQHVAEVGIHRPALPSSPTLHRPAATSCSANPRVSPAGDPPSFLAASSSGLASANDRFWIRVQAWRREMSGRGVPYSTVSTGRGHAAERAFPVREFASGRSTCPAPRGCN